MGHDGQEEELTEYMCDSPGCPNIAIQTLGVVELGFFAAVCEQHIPQMEV